MTSSFNMNLFLSQDRISFVILGQRFGPYLSLGEFVTSLFRLMTSMPDQCLLGSKF